MGNDIFLTYNNIPYQNGWKIGSGIPVHSTTLGLNLSYEIWENTFIDLSGTHRSYNVENQPNSSVFFWSMAFRMNIARRVFDF